MYSCLGRGLFAREDITKGQFIAQYYGDLISSKSGDSRELDGEWSAFRYFFTDGKHKFW
jgi:hypothetical protein